jgi:hypothetical protein
VTQDRPRGLRIGHAADTGRSVLPPASPAERYMERSGSERPGQAGSREARPDRGRGIEMTTSEGSPMQRYNPEERIVLSGSSQVLNLGYALRRRLDEVARAEQLDGTALGRRIIFAAVMAREQPTNEDEHE